MRPEKPGLADLKRLHSEQREAEAPKAAGRAKPGPASTRPATSSRRGSAGGTEPADSAARAKLQDSSRSVLDKNGITAGHGQAAFPPVTELDDEDRALFRQAVKTVQPIKDARRASLSPRKQASDLLRQRREHAMGRETASLSAVSDHYAPARLKHDDTSFLQAGHGPDLIKGLKRGKWPIEASLDLHGSTLDEARGRLEQFLQSCLAHRIKCVRIVHGKGFGSKDGASVLKQTVRRWLSQMRDVKAYTECGEQDGGAGAIQALLKVDAPQADQ
jgi:DNA-nicking Smr family endonuclease